jgi:hypothetical protein
MFEQFEPVGMTERLGDFREPSEHALFRTGT